MSARKNKPREKTVSPSDVRENKGQKTGASKAAEESAATTDLSCPVVGIGASAGGLAAFESFFSGMPVNTPSGMAFVIVQHLAPDHKSILTDLIKRYTPMEVFEVTDGMQVQANCTYIIPPNHDMAIFGDKLQLFEPSAPRGQRLPIDFFFSSLAKDRGHRAICIILSGTGSDGTNGLRAVKAEGGLVMAQTPASSDFEGMPRSAIDNGLVDYQLRPEEMAVQLIAYAAHAFSRPPENSLPTPHQENNALERVFTLLRAQTGHDFSQYKPTSICRRIERRQAIHQIDSIDKYIKLLERKPSEIEALFSDLLIGVTGFFRDPEIFKALEEQVIPKLFANKPAGSVIRVWSVGCATGEEAYSLAILLHEHMEKLIKKYKVQLFATDIDGQAVATARRGRYPAAIATDILPKRLTRYFSVDGDRNYYQVDQDLREILIFSEQNIIKDPPFSKIDLLICRNLLIYLGADIQKKLIPLFHYALNPGGFLFLGSSETIGEFGDSFATLDRKSRLYTRKEYLNGLQQRWAKGRFLTTIESHAVRPKSTGDPTNSGKMSLRELTEQALLHQIAPIGALVDGNGNILYLHGRTGMYLELAPGEVSVNNILRMARDGLRVELGSALRQAITTRTMVHRTGMSIKINSTFIHANLTVCPLPSRPVLQNADTTAPASPALSMSFFLIIFEEAIPCTPLQASVDFFEEKEDEFLSKSKSSVAKKANVLIAALKQKLEAKEEYLQNATAELATINEEMQSTNEELETSREEMQAINEELETSKEEMQSINEELTIINAELQIKVTDLSRINNDMNNLLAGTGIATIFVDLSLHVLRFTPAATKIINLMSTDIGRPVNHFVTSLVGYDRLITDIKTVLDTLVTQEVEVESSKGDWYTLRIHPYRTLENIVEGAVITFIDITETKKAKEMLSKTNELLRLAVVGRDCDDAVIVQDLDGRILAWNPGATKNYGWSEAEALTMHIGDLIPEELRHQAQMKVQELFKAKSYKPYQSRRISKDGVDLEVSMTSTVLLDETGEIYAIATTEKTIGEKTDKVSEEV